MGDPDAAFPISSDFQTNRTRPRRRLLTRNEGVPGSSPGVGFERGGLNRDVSAAECVRERPMCRPGSDQNRA
jgi:hypothetical protein